MKFETIGKAYAAASEVYSEVGVDTSAVLKQMKTISISLHCWQGDDIGGFESKGGGASGGIMSTGNYPGKARNGDELRQDLDQALRLLPGRNRVNLHAIYAETGGKLVDRDALETKHFQNWIGWARERGLALDFNPTYFGHPLASDNMTLSHPDAAIRRFWTDHGKASRRIAASFGEALGKTSVNNIWIPDGTKDLTPARAYYRQLLRDSLDEILTEKLPASDLVDAVECKLFGIGIESFTVGSHEFYLGYLAHARERGANPILTLDMGHFHPTETIADKLSAILLFSPRILIHVSRGIRWDSDHVVITDDNILDVMREVKRMGAFNRAWLATDFFDASINRIAAWVIGARATQKAVLAALLEPTDLMLAAEKEGRLSDRLALMEESRSLPCAAVWNQYCLEEGVPPGNDFMADIHAYETRVLSSRG